MSVRGPQVGSTFLTYRAPGEWTDRAACQGSAPAFDGPLPGEKAEQTDARVKASLAVCRSCPVRASCLAWTLDQPRRHRQGVMAGKFWSVVHPATAERKAA